MESITFLLDGQDRGQPLNWDEFGVTIQFQKDSRATFASFDSDLIFSGSAYNYISAAKDESGYCHLIDVEVLDTCNSQARSLVKGYIVLTDCEFDLDKCQVKTKLVDDSFQARINNNKSICAFLNTPTTKNNEPLTDPYLIHPSGQIIGGFRNPSNGDYYLWVGVKGAWSVFNCFKILVAFMSDNKVEFESEYFRYGDGRAYFIVSGGRLRASAAFTNLETAYPTTSFVTLYTAFANKLNLGFAFKRGTSGKPILVIEQKSFFENNPAGFYLDDVPGVITSFDSASIYANIALGSGEYKEEWEGNNNNARLSMPQIRFRGFKDETFGLCGECNVDTTNNLTTKGIIFDSNIIEDIIKYANENYQDEPVCIEVQLTSIADAYLDAGNVISPAIANQVDIFGINRFYFNTSLTNDNQAANNIDGVPCSIWDYYQGYDANNTVVEVENSGAAPIPDPDHEMQLDTSITYYSDSTTPMPSGAHGAGHYALFQTEINDPGGNFTPNETYIIPAPGIYTFTCKLARHAPVNSPLNPAGALINWQIILRRFAPNDILISSDGGASFISFATTNEEQTHVFTIFANEGDKIKFDVAAQTSYVLSPVFLSLYSSIVPALTQSLTVSGQPIQGGKLQPADPSKLQLINNKFKYPLTRSQVLSLINDTTQGLEFSRDIYPHGMRLNNINRITVSSINRGIADFDLRQKI